VQLPAGQGQFARPQLSAQMKTQIRDKPARPVQLPAGQGQFARPQLSAQMKTQMF
jgi:hypothetical protein